jgi:NhaA family Na+:H+ antiporter
MTISGVFREFVRSERAGGALLVLCAVISLVLANSPWAAEWQAIWKRPLGPLTVQQWVNDALMTLFFLLVGLELEREIYIGELSDFRTALLPLVAALGGIAVPAAIHFALNHDTPAQAGAGIPMATDIAFALAAIGLLGDRVPMSLKVFLTAFAVIDDLAAILVIALAYSNDIAPGYLAAAGAVFALLVAANRMRTSTLAFYLAGGVALWFFVLQSGVHPTVAGVLLAFAVPFGPREPIERSPSHRLEQWLHKPVAFGVLPLFALANTGIVVSGAWTALADSNSVGILLGLVVGKPVGIMLACLVAALAGLRRPADVTWAHIAGAGMLGGIGFTMSIFITQLAFPAPNPLASSSTLAIMVASVTAAVVGVAWLAASSRMRRP